MLTKEPKSNAVIRNARDVDVVKICEVLIRSVREVCASDYNNDEAILQDWCSNKKPESVGSWIRDPDNYFVVAELNPHGIVGAAMYKRSEASVDLCYLVPEALHQGVGSDLLAELESEAARLGHKVIRLGSSITARDFYQRHGYASDGQPIHWGKVLGFPMRKEIAA